MARKRLIPGSAMVVVFAVLMAGAAHGQVPPLDGHYSDGVFGYRADYPFGWKVTYQTYGTGVRVSPPGDETAWIAVWAIEEKTGAALDRIAAAYEKAVGSQVRPTSTDVLKTLQLLLAEMSDDASKTNTGNAGSVQPSVQRLRQRSIVVDGASGVHQELDGGHVTVLILRDKVLYGLQLVAPPAYVHAYEPIFDAIVGSFRFQPKLKVPSR